MESKDFYAFHVKLKKVADADYVSFNGGRSVRGSVAVMVTCFSNVIKAPLELP